MAELSVDTALLKARAHAKKGEITEAKQLYHIVLQTFPKNKRAQQGLAALNKSTQPNGLQGPPQETINQMINLYNRGQLAVVVDKATLLTEQYPESFVVWNILGAASKGLGRFADASNAFGRVTELEPNYAEAYYSLGVVLKEQDKLDEAIASYKKALSLKPDYAEAYNNMGFALQDQGKLDKAIGCYSKALSLKPDYAGAHNNMGITLKDTGKLDEAIASYKKALLLKPGYAGAHNNMGAALKDKGKLDDAIASYNQALSFKPDYAEAYNNKGIALQDQGQFDEAIASYTKALSIKPDYAAAYNNMGNTLKIQGKIDKAIASYIKALSIKPDYAEAYYNMGVTLQDQGKFDEAVASYNKALSLKPNYKEAHYNMGNALQDKGKLDDAIASYIKALAIKPDYVEAYLNTVELLKIISPKSIKAHTALHIDKKVKEIGKSLLASDSNKEIALKLSNALKCIGEDGLNFKTPLSQIYKRNSIDLNCSRHKKIFNNEGIIPEFCFGCFKVQVEVDDLFSLIRLTKQFYELKLEDDIGRKTMIEMRPEIPGFYKGLLYCRGLDQARAVKESLDIKLKDIFADQITSHIKRGCSEFPLKFSNYGEIIDDKITTMNYPTNWKVVEEQFDRNSSSKQKKNITPSIPGYCLSDFYIIQKWIDYAKGLNDPTSREFDDYPTVFHDVFDIAVLRKAKYGKTFSRKN